MLEFLLAAHLLAASQELAVVLTQLLVHAVDQLGTRQWWRGEKRHLIFTYSATSWSPVGLLRSTQALLLEKINRRVLGLG